MPSLTDLREETFARALASGETQKRAAQLAGYGVSNEYGHLQVPEVAARVRELIEQRLAVAGITKDRVLQEIARCAFASAKQLVHPDGRLKEIHELDDDTAATITGMDIEITREGHRVLKLRRADKGAHVTLLAKFTKVVGDEGEGMSQIASALADRLGTAKKRVGFDSPAEDIAHRDVIETEEEAETEPESLW